jgi:hypothetical protein
MIGTVSVRTARRRRGKDPASMIVLNGAAS